MKVCFIIYELDYADHIAIAYLSSIAREIGLDRQFYQIKSNKNVIKNVVHYQPDIVAYSVNVSGFKAVCDFHNELSKRIKFISIMGGPQATFDPESFYRSNMNAYCIGEGDFVFKDFAELIVEGKDFSNVPNLITKKTSNEVRPLIEDINKLPMPDRDLTISNSFLKKSPKKTFYTTRGCPYKCSYCCNNRYHAMYKGKGNMVRKFSVERTIKEICDVKKKYRMDYVKFGDDVFIINADEWLKQFSVEYPRFIGVPFNCYLRFDIVNDDVLHLLKKSGCHSVHLSVDSTSEHVRERILRRQMSKNINIADKLKLIRKYKINTWVNYMLAAPDSSLQNDIDTIYLNRKGKVTCPSYSTTTPMKGTDLYEYCLNKKITNPVFDMTGWGKKSSLTCFGDKEKNIRYNIYLLGAFVSKLPFPLCRIGIFVIKTFPPNIIFKKIHDYMYRYFYNFRIFRLSRLFKITSAVQKICTVFSK